MSQYALEKHRFFPYVAWTLIVSFSLYVWHLTTVLSATATTLATEQSVLKEAVTSTISIIQTEP